MGASLKIRSQRAGRVSDTITVQITQTGLTSIGTGQPTKQMIEGTVFHHHEHHMLDPGTMRFGQSLGAGRGRGRADIQKSPADHSEGTCRCPSEEVAAGDALLAEAG